MMLELLVVFEILAFIFLSLGIIPFKGSSDLDGRETSLPLINKVIFLVIATILFFSLAMIANSFDYVYCFVDSTSVSGTVAVNTAMCAVHEIESQAVSYINFGMGIIAVLIALVVVLIAGFSSVQMRNDGDQF